MPDPTFPDQAARAAAFRALHARPGAFVIPNPWDAGTARILAALGFEALATTSAGLAYALGLQGRRGEPRADARQCPRHRGRDRPAGLRRPGEWLRRCPGGRGARRSASPPRRAWSAARSRTRAATRRGRSTTSRHAVERVAAAVEAARALPSGFVLTARAENFLHGRPDLDDTIRRLQAFERAGADVLYAPGLPSLEAIRAVCSAVSRPVNVLAGGSGPVVTVATLAGAGVKRISLGSALSRAALGGLIRAAREVREHGTFGFAPDALPYAEANGFMLASERH